MAESPLACPVCRARFRESRECSRCGADLSRLMQIALESLVLRRAARAALAAGDVQGALRRVRIAQGLRHTPSGRDLDLLCRWLAAAGSL